MIDLLIRVLSIFSKKRPQYYFFQTTRFMSEGKFKRLVEENYELEQLVNYEMIERLKASKMAATEALELIDKVFKKF